MEKWFSFQLVGKGERNLKNERNLKYQMLQGDIRG